MGNVSCCTSKEAGNVGERLRKKKPGAFCEVVATQLFPQKFNGSPLKHRHFPNRKRSRLPIIHFAGAFAVKFSGGVFFYVHPPNPWRFMIQFDVCIFRWVGISTHQLVFVEGWRGEKMLKLHVFFGRGHVSCQGVFGSIAHLYNCNNHISLQIFIWVFFKTNLLLSNDVSGTTATVVAVTVNGEFRLLENTPRGFFLFWVKSVILIPFWSVFFTSSRQLFVGCKNPLSTQ